MRIFILAIKDGPTWACDNIYSDWKSFLPNTLSKLADCDIIWLLSNWQWRSIPLEFLQNKKVVCTIHHIVEDKFDYENFLARDKFVNAYHVPCEITKNILSKHTNKNITVLPYWYVAKNWTKQSNKELLKSKYRLPIDKLLIGSFQRDTEGSDLKSPKLEKGPDLFCDIIENLSLKPHVILTGWRRNYVIIRLERKNISYSYFELADFKTMNDLYNCLDYYLITSRVEGGPQALLEGLASGVKVLSSKVGMSPEVLPDAQLCENVDDFRNIIEKEKSDNINSRNHENYEFDKVSKLYLNFFKTLHENFSVL